MASDKLDSPCNFDILFSKNVPHILEKTFFFLDYESYKNCLEVSREWKGVLTSKRHISKGRLVFEEKIVEDEKKLCIAATLGNTNKVRKLLESGMIDVNCNTGSDWTPLHWAADRGHKEVAELLIESGAEVKKVDDRGWTPLHSAAERGHKEVAEILIESGAEVNKVADRGWTPLHWAALRGHTRVVEALLSHKDIQVNVAGNYNSTPMGLAAENGHAQVVELLLERMSAEFIDIADNHGDYPLTMAAREGHDRVVELLLSRPDISLGKKDQSGDGRWQRRTALYWVRKKCNKRIIRMLKEKLAMNDD